jgi:hypothetical protein
MDMHAFDGERYRALPKSEYPPPHRIAFDKQERLEKYMEMGDEHCRQVEAQMQNFIGPRYIHEDLDRANHVLEVATQQVNQYYEDHPGMLTRARHRGFTRILTEHQQRVKEAYRESHLVKRSVAQKKKQLKKFREANLRFLQHRRQL